MPALRSRTIYLILQSRNKNGYPRLSWPANYNHSSNCDPVFTVSVTVPEAEQLFSCNYQQSRLNFIELLGWVTHLLPATASRTIRRTNHSGVLLGTSIILLRYFQIVLLDFHFCRRGLDVENDNDRNTRYRRALFLVHCYFNLYQRVASVTGLYNMNMSEILYY